MDSSDTKTPDAETPNASPPRAETDHSQIQQPNQSAVIMKTLSQQLAPMASQLSTIYASSQRAEHSYLEIAQRLESIQRALEALVDTTPDIRPLSHSMKHLAERLEAMHSKLHSDLADPLNALRELLFDSEESHGAKLDSLDERLTASAILQDEVVSQITKLERGVFEQAQRNSSMSENIFLGVIILLLMANFGLSIWSVNIWLEAIK